MSSSNNKTPTGNMLKILETSVLSNNTKKTETDRNVLTNEAASSPTPLTIHENVNIIQRTVNSPQL